VRVASGNGPTQREDRTSIAQTNCIEARAGAHGTAACAPRQPRGRGGSLEPLSQLSQLSQLLERAGPKERGLSQRGPPKWRLHGVLS
jgi:hypothetical protein